MATLEWLYKIGIAVVQNNELLLCKPHAFADLIMPGGLRTQNETSEETLRRQIAEELGSMTVLQDGSLQYLGNFRDFAAGRPGRGVEIELYSGEIIGTPIASSEIEELFWVGPGKVAHYHLSPIVQNEIFPFLMASRRLV